MPHKEEIRKVETKEVSMEGTWVHTTEEITHKMQLKRAHENLVDAQLEASFQQAYLKLVQCRKMQVDRRLEKVVEELRKLEEKGEKKNA